MRVLANDPLPFMSQLCHRCGKPTQLELNRELLLCSLTKAGDALSDAIPPTRPTRREALFLSRRIRYSCCPSQGKFCFLSSFSLLFIERTYHWWRHSLFNYYFLFEARGGLRKNQNVNYCFNYVV